jgi:hypothetical protein
MAGLLIGSVFDILVDDAGPGWYVPLGFTVLLIVAVYFSIRRTSFAGSLMVLLCVTGLLASAAILAWLGGQTGVGIAGLLLALLVLLFWGAVLWKVEPVAGWWARKRAWLMERPGDAHSEQGVE